MNFCRARFCHSRRESTRRAFFVSFKKYGLDKFTAGMTKMTKMTTTDQLDRTITLPVWPPRRIISLVPSQTELLHYLGLEAEVVGITKFCVHPPDWFQTKPRVGGTKTLNFEKIEALKPDLIIGNKEENERAQIEQLSKRWPVWMSDINSLDDAKYMIEDVGALVGKEAEARQLLFEIEEAEEASIIHHIRHRAAYFIWRKPYMVAGGGTFINDMLWEAGFDNVFKNQLRYPEITLDDLITANPEVILLSSEPYPFAEKHLQSFQEVCPGAHIRVVDGEMFSWYGPRIVSAFGYFFQLWVDIFDKD